MEKSSLGHIIVGILDWGYNSTISPYFNTISAIITCKISGYMNLFRTDQLLRHI